MSFDVDSNELTEKIASSRPITKEYIDFINALDEPEPGKKMELSLTLVPEFGAALVGCLMTGAIRLEDQNTETATTP